MDSFIGKMLDNRYEILEVIGSGGMAVVYKALCHRLNRFVAVKILKADMAKDADFRRRFHAESQAVAMLSHPNIVAVYDVSRSSDIEYIVMELIDGITLKQYMQRKGVLSWRETLHFSTQIVKALSHAHNRGIIHRDIKPHNIMVLRDGSVKVADFGIARLPSVQNTLTQEALGSVHYISPEQARGSHIDGRSDLYSLGVVMYEMLTGRLPFEGDSAVTVAIQHINSAPLWPRDINSDIPEPLEAITMKAMCASLSTRYVSAEEMQYDLEEFRKNPNIVFEFETKKFPSEDNLEPTQALPKTRALVPQPQERQVARNPRMIPPDEDYDRKRKTKRLTILTGVAAILVFVAGMVMLIGQILGITSPGTTSPSPPSEDDIVLESLVGLSYTAASEKYKDLLVLERNPEDEFHDSYAEGVIIRQDISVNTRLAKGSTVKVTVSKGKKTFSLVKLAGLSQTDAQVKLIEVGLKYDVTYIYSDDVVKDQVIRTEPEAGEEVRTDDTILLIVSSGPDVKMTTVPNLVGAQETDVRRLLERNNLLRGGTTEEFSDKPVGEVLSHTPKAGDEVPEKSAVDIVVSKGPEPEPEPTDAPPTSTPSPDNIQPTIITIRFPVSEGIVHTVVKQNDIIILDENKNAAQERFVISLTGSSSDVIKVYFDGELTYEETLGAFQ